MSCGSLGCVFVSERQQLSVGHAFMCASTVEPLMCTGYISLCRKFKPLSDIQPDESSDNSPGEQVSSGESGAYFPLSIVEISRFIFDTLMVDLNHVAVVLDNVHYSRSGHLNLPRLYCW